MMTRELIIEGQRVDLADSTDITLEYASNVLSGGSGKINLSRSYTIKLPKTARNARILDDPGSPAHASAGVRRFLEARYYQNGIDLLGEAQAYMLQTTEDAYELALVWNALPELQALSEGTQTINDLQGLPVLTWIGQNGATPDYTGGSSDDVLFAWYDSGLGGHAYPEVNAGTHPCASAAYLIGQILEQAGVPYTVSSQRVKAALSNMYIVAAPSHKPNREMEIASGSSQNVRTYFYGTLWPHGGPLEYWAGSAPASWANGWDSTVGETNQGARFFRGASAEHRVHINLRAPEGVDLSEAYLVVKATDGAGAAISQYADLLRVYFMHDGASYYVSQDVQINLSEWADYYISLEGLTPDTNVAFSKYDASLPFIASNRVHPVIDIAYDNRFPLAGNLPDIKQWDFVKACLVLAGAVPVIQNGELLVMGYDEAFDKADAYDWTEKVTGTEAVAYSAQEWARKNVISYEREDGMPLSFDPDASIEVQDSTLAQSRELYKLPFAATQYSSIIHYEVTDEGAAEDIDIEPRIMRLRVGTDTSGASRYELVFAPELYGEGLKAAYYAELQEVVRVPVILTLHVRLHELDLATLDLRRPVYLRQYGHYYSIIKVQTSGDVCKVELIQIP